MQNTRLNNLIGASLTQLRVWSSNPWRKISLFVISLLFGIFLGTAIPTTAGQKAELDLTGAAILVFLTELVSRYVYRQHGDKTNSQFLPQLINCLKIGMTYGLFIEAFKLAS
ncbi:DUF565 domain-containing protein [Merismopedia glauca]|uniref:DUF565 domain-containing protein n=1 Tax=Merismopedia glauca CCAP 1448/3 TaxID=1296344 RepID=A0A2T1C969_9CYAN|nr:DUF565 domain-containing protein [Merismopedia glauca]PSB04810.1 hypothetical protein C7B64_02300 [Merismopedia glauca CCAP 1448/3]